MSEEAAVWPAEDPVLRAIAMPSDTNPEGDIFGGWLVSQMDLAGATIAFRRAQGRCVTVAIDGMSFISPVFVGDEVSLFARLVHTDITHAYFVVLVLHSALGLAMIAFLLNEFPIRPRLRQIALVLFALGAVTPHLGLNYTFFRFASPLAFFLLTLRAATTPLRSAALFSLAIVLECTIAPELAFALAAGILVYACCAPGKAVPFG